MPKENNESINQPSFWQPSAFSNILLLCVAYSPDNWSPCKTFVEHLALDL